MLRIVLPVVSASGRQGAGAIDIARVDVSPIDIRVVVVAHVVVVDVNVHIAVPPPAAPSPSAVVVGTAVKPAPKGNRNTRCVITRRRIIDWRLGGHGRS